MLKQPDWLRALEIITGLLAMIIGVLVFIHPRLGVETLVLLLSIGLLFDGLRSISVVFHRGLSNGLKVLNVVTGILALILAAFVIIFPGFGARTLLIFVSFGLLVYGVGRLFAASILKATSSWIRGLMVAVGVVDLILSIVVLLLSGLALLTSAVVLSVVLLFSGAEGIVSGAIGRTWIKNVVEAVKKIYE